jgi:hypothetical protein
LTHELKVASRPSASNLASDEESGGKAAFKDTLAEQARGSEPSEKAPAERDLAMAPPAAPAPAAAAAAPEKEALKLEDRIPSLVKNQLQAGQIKGAVSSPAPAAGPAPSAAEDKAKIAVATAPAAKDGSAALDAGAGTEAKSALREEAKMAQFDVNPSDVERKLAPPAIEPGKVIKGLVEAKTLLLRAEDLPAASAEVKGILSRYGAQVSKDLYEGGTLEGAGARIRARVPGPHYQALVAELRTKKYLAVERAKAPAKAAKPAAPKTLSIPETVDLTIKFQAQVSAPAAPAKQTPAAK